MTFGGGAVAVGLSEFCDIGDSPILVLGEGYTTMTIREIERTGCNEE